MIINNLTILLLGVLFLLFQTLALGKTIEPCKDMTKSGPLCLATPQSELSLGSNNSFKISSSIVNELEQYFVLFKSSYSTQQLNVRGYQRTGSQFLPILADKIIKDDCNGASIEGESIRFMNSSSDYMLLSGWFKTIKPVCIGPVQVSVLSTGLVRKVPFIAILSNTTVSSVMNLENDFYDYELSSLDIDKNSGNIYVLMQKSSELWLGVYQRDGQLIFKKQFGKCNAPTNCKLVKIHYSNVYDRIVILIKESDSKSLTIEGNTRSFPDSQSAYWFVLLNVDGAHIHTHRVFHSISTLLAIPKVEFDSIGTTILLFACKDGCYLNDRSVDSNVFLLKYDYIKTNTPIVKNFMLKTNPKNLNISSPIIHSLSLERDLTINAVITGFNDTYVIQDNIDRTMSAAPFSNYLYRFRHSDGKIINLMQVSNGDNFVISSPSSLVNTNPKVTEQSTIFFSNGMNFTILTYHNYRNTHDNEFILVSKSTNLSGRNEVRTLLTKITQIEVCLDDLTTIQGMRFYGSNSSVSMGKLAYKGDKFSIDEDEYFVQISTKLFGSRFQCVKVRTNKKEFDLGTCRPEDGYWISSFKTYNISTGLDVIGVEITGNDNYIMGVSFLVGYAKTYSCNVGWGGTSCMYPSCFGLDSSSPQVCSGKSKCIAPNVCESCISTESSQGKNCLSYGYYCHDSYSPFNERTCTSAGTCLSNSSCHCYTGFYGAKCETPALCYGISKIDKNVCSGNGYCVDTNQCKCNPGYVGLSCEIPVCYGMMANSSSVCSSHGSCVTANACSCKQGYYGNNCEKFNCNGIQSNNRKACYSKGNCTDLDTCACQNGYFGQFCELTTCNGLLMNDTNVCGGRGECISFDVCSCTHSYGINCEMCSFGYFGSKCEQWKCGGIMANSSTVCSNRRGSCTSPSSCECNEYSYGLNCESCLDNHFGDLCSDWRCNGILNSNDSVCNYRGSCYDFNKCYCNSYSTGRYCEKCTARREGRTCSQCTAGYYGTDCIYSIESNSVKYIPYMEENTAYVGFVVNFNAIVVSPTIDIGDFHCDQFLKDVQKLSSSTNTDHIKCRVKKPTGQRYPIEVWLSKEKAIFDPRNPIMFNINFPQTWFSRESPIYIPITLDMNDFERKFGNNHYTGIIVSNARIDRKILNRCYENVITTDFIQPDIGPIRSITWKIDSTCLNGIEIVKNVIQKAQNTLSFTLPYLKELKYCNRIDVSLNIITNWNLTYFSNEVFTVDGSYPKTFLNNPYYVTLTTPTFSIPLTTFFSENFECIDGNTMQVIESKLVKAEFTKDSIILKPRSYRANFDGTVTFDNRHLTFRFHLEPSEVYIKETVLSQSNPLLTIECNSIYGQESDDVDIVWIMTDSKVVAKSIYTGPLKMDVRSFTPPLNSYTQQLLTVYCSKLDRQYSIIDNLQFFAIFTKPEYIAYNRPGPGKSDRLISFSSAPDASGCRVLSVNFKTKIPNFIPFGIITLDLEITTTESTNCQVDIHVVDTSSTRKRLLERIVTNSEKTLLPIKSYHSCIQSSSVNNNGACFEIGSRFILSAMGNADVSDYSLTVNVQTDPFENRYQFSCTISPTNLQIGFTEADLVCDMSQFASSSIIWTLFLDGVDSGTFSSFPIKFKANKAVSTFRIMATDTTSGGQDFLRMDLNNVEYSTDYLATGEAVDSILSELTNSSENYHTKNDLVITMISNIHTITNDSVLNQISKLIPLALTATAKSVHTQLDKENFPVTEVAKYINQVKVLSKPQFLNHDSTTATLEVLNKFVNISKDTSFWNSNSPQPLTEILVNLASNIPEQSLIQTSTSIVDSVISFGAKRFLVTSDLYPTEKPSNLVSVQAVKSSSPLVTDFYFEKSQTRLISFNVSSNDSIVQVSNSLFKYPKLFKYPRLTEEEGSNRDFISYLSLSSLSGSARVSIPLTNFSYPSNSSFRCIVMHHNVNFDMEEQYCKFINTSKTLLSITTTSPQDFLLVDCLCDLSALSILLGRSDNIIGITAEYFVKVDHVKVDSGGVLQKGDPKDVTIVISIIVILICCLCIIVALPTIIFILARRFKKRKSTKVEVRTQLLEIEFNPEEIYSQYVPIADPNPLVATESRQYSPPSYDIAMQTFSSFPINEEPKITM